MTEPLDLSMFDPDSPVHVPLRFLAALFDSLPQAGELWPNVAFPPMMAFTQDAVAANRQGFVGDRSLNDDDVTAELDEICKAAWGANGRERSEGGQRPTPPAGGGHQSSITINGRDPDVAYEMAMRRTRRGGNGAR